MRYHPEQLLDYIQGQKSRFIELTEKLVRHETPSGYPRLQETLLNFLASRLSDLDYHTFHIRGEESGGMLYARPDEKEANSPYQLVLGYSDTSWPRHTIDSHPFSNHSSTLHGPGVYDMKAGLSMIVLALETLHEFDIKPAYTPVILVYSDETNDSGEAIPTLRRLSRDARRAFVLRPSLGKEGNVITSSTGFGRYNLRIREGPSKAGYAPDSSSDSILALSKIVQQFYELNNGDHDIKIDVSNLDDGINANVVTGENKATIDVHLESYDSINYIENEVARIASNTSSINMSIKGSIQRPPMQPNKRNAALWESASNYAEELGITLKQGRSKQASIASIASSHTATIDGMGPVGSRNDKRGESVNISQTLQRNALLSLLLASS